MKALSIMQPWAWLIVNGHKDIENRDWKPWNPGLKYRGPVLIHAGKKHDGDPEFWDHDPIEPPAALDYGGIVGEAEIVDVVTASDSPWFCGPYGLVIRNARALPFQPCRGQLGFFTPDFCPPDLKPLKPEKADLFNIGGT